MKLIEVLKGKGHATQILRGVSGGILISGTSALLALFTSAILARGLGPDGFGRYSFAFSLAMLLAIPAQAGLPVLVLREIAKYQVQNEWGLMKGLIRNANIIAGTFALTVLCLSAIVLFSMKVDSESYWLYIASFSLIPLLALGNIRGAILQGLGHVVIGQLPENLIRPIVLFLGVVAYFLLKIELTPVNTMVWHGFSSFIALIIGAILLRINLPVELLKAEPTYENKKWIQSLVPLSLIAGVQVLHMQIGIVLLQYFHESRDVGIYRATFQIATLIIFGLSIVGNVLSPHIARLYFSGEFNRLQLMVRNATRIIFLAALFPAAGCLFFGEEILTTVYGYDYVSGYSALIVIVFAQLISAGYGPTGYLMNMTGKEGSTAKVMLITTALNIVLSFVFIPILGVIGAAIAFGSALIYLNIHLSILIKEKINIKCGLL